MGLPGGFTPLKNQCLGHCLGELSNAPKERLSWLEECNSHRVSMKLA